MNSWEELEGRLIRLAKSDLPFERLAAVNTLEGFLQHSFARSLLSELSADENLNVRSSAQNALGVSPSSVTRSENLPREEQPPQPSNSTPFSLIYESLEYFQPQYLSSKTLPQANTLDLVLRVARDSEAVSKNPEDFARTAGITSRQVHYYLDAARILGLTQAIEGPEGVATTGDGQNSNAANLRKILDSVVARFLPIRYSVCSEFLSPELSFNIDDGLQKFFETEFGKFSLAERKLSDSTLIRRKQTLMAWDKQLKNELETYRIEWPENEEELSPEPFDLAFPIADLFLELESDDVLGSRIESVDLLLLRNSYSQNSYIARARKDLTFRKIGAQIGVSGERVRQLEAALLSKIDYLIDFYDFLWKVPLREFVGGENDVLSLPLLKAKIASRVSNSGRIELESANWLPEFSKSTLEEKDLPEPQMKAYLVLDVLTGRILEKFGFTPSKVNRSMWQSQESRSSWPRDGLFQPALTGKKGFQDKLSQVTDFLETKGAASAEEVYREFGFKTLGATREFLRRNFGSGYNHLSKLWTATATPLDSHEKFKNAYEAVFWAIKEHGPISPRDIRLRLMEVHPVSQSRIMQALDDERVGQTDSGLYDMVARGARRRVESEPDLPGAILESDEGFTWRLVVGKDHLRGSSTPAPRWIGWRLGLSATPAKRSFHSAHNDTSMYFSRRGGQIFLSTTKQILQGLAAREGCQVQVSIFVSAGVFSVDHICHPTDRALS